MKTFILAAGLGTRLKKYTKYIPKPCLKINQTESIISKLITKLNRYNFIDSYIINIHKLPHKIVNGVYKITDKNIIFSYEKQLLGTAGALKNIENIFNDNEDILIIYGDLLINADLELYYNIFRQNNYNILILLDRLKNIEDLNKKGIVEYNNNVITKFIEKPNSIDKLDKEIYYNSGIYFMKKEMLKEIPSNKHYDFGKDLFPKLLNDNITINCIVMNMEEYVFDIGTEEDYKMVLNN